VRQNNTIDAFFALVRAGLWEKDVMLSHFGEVDYNEVYQLAKEQSVVGLLAAGIEHIIDVKPPKNLVLDIVGESLQLEQRNTAMNRFIAQLVEKMRNADIYTLLVKGQGVAQCYERPLWRASGDVDFYLSDTNFEKAQKYFRPLVEAFDPDTDSALHINMHYEDWVVELHANQRCSLSAKINRVIDEIHDDLFYNGNIRIWKNGSTQVFLPAPDNDVLLVFTHFLNHFYKGGLGIRQICDWCRLLWTFRNVLDIQLLENRLKKMGLMSIWKAFASFAVDYLGTPKEAMPFYSAEKSLSRKAEKICAFIIEVGNFGHNRDTSYYSKDSRFIRKVCSFGRRCGDIFSHARIFPLESIRFFPYLIYCGIKAAAQGE
jgi:hypothetical protein